jgi:hypothetical protein
MALRFMDFLDKLLDATRDPRQPATQDERRDYHGEGQIGRLLRV